MLYLINRYYDPATGQFVSVDPMVAQTGQVYAYAGDDPVNGSDPLGLCNSGITNSYYPGPCATTAAQAERAAVYLQSHASSGGGFSFSNGLKAVADYGAGIANFAVSTATFGNVHISNPYCGFGWASDIGYGYGALATAAFGVGAIGASAEASDAADLTTVGRWMSPTEYDTMVSSGTVQEGSGGVTYVSNPASLESFESQAASGSSYAEFDVPSESLSQAGKAEWSAIKGPNSWWAKVGLANTEMPSATNIQWIASKL